MSGWQIANYVAWITSALILMWLIKDFTKANKEFDESILLGYEDSAEFGSKVQVNEGGAINE